MKVKVVSYIKEWRPAEVLSEDKGNKGWVAEMYLPPFNFTVINLNSEETINLNSRVTLISYERTEIMKRQNYIFI